MWPKWQTKIGRDAFLNKKLKKFSKFKKLIAPLKMLKTLWKSSPQKLTRQQSRK